MKKVLSVLISIITVITMLSGVQTVFAESELVLGQISKVSLEHDGKTQTYVYTPKKSGKYVLSSHAKEGIDPKCTVLIYSSGEPVAMIEDTDGFGNNFKEIIELDQGTKYLFVFGMNNKIDAAEYDVDLFEYGTPSPEPDPEPPAKATGLYTAGRGEDGTKINLEWDLQTNVDKYFVYQKIDGAFQKIGETYSNDFEVSKLVPGCKYYFKVAAVNDDGVGEMSDELCTCTSISKIENLTAQLTENGSIKLTWTAVECDGYSIEWSKDADFESGVQTINLTGKSNDSYTIANPDKSIKYYVRIRAFLDLNNEYFYGGFSQAEVSDIVSLSKVTGLISAGRGENGTRIRLGWDAQENAASYNVYQKIDGEYKFIGNTQSNDFNVTGLNPSWEYYFKVAAVNGDKVGEMSDELHTVSACAAVKDFTAKAVNGNTIQLNWTKGVCHGYFIQWSTDPTFKTGVQYKNVAYSQLDSYTINVNGNAQNYYVRIRAWRNWNDGYVYGDFTQATAVMAKVTGLISAGRGENGTRIRIGWDAQENAESYNVYQKIDGKYKLIGNTKSNDFNVAGLNPSWEYYFKVAAVKNSTECEMSDELYTVSACAAVEDFTVTAKDANTIQLNWTKGVCHGYFIQWSTDPTFKTGVQYKNVAYSQLDSYTINVNGNAQKYYVRIRAWRNWDGGYVYGDFSQPVKADAKL